MNRLSLTHLAPKGSSPPHPRSRGRPRGSRRFSQHLRSNGPLRSLALRQLQTSNRDVLEPPPNSFTPTMPPRRRRHCQRWTTPANLILDERSVVCPVVLEEEFRFREDAYLVFFSEVNDSTTREAIGYFQVNIENAVKYMDHICCCCSRFVNLLELKSIPDNDVVWMAAFETYILHRCDLDVCGCCSRSIDFCHNCWTCVSRGGEPKFDISNKIPKLCCQYYPAPLEDLTSAEKAVIARTHPVVIILKLRPNNSFNPRTYRGVCRYSVLLPQNPGPLLTLLLLLTTSVDDVVRVVWVGKTSP